ncbi:hypothetical protein GUJ93_ZPchr0006g44670 [Zizania palustris]|uniref:Uncharacterized protein n=1 Tax=Zizania palustris TaxID=103762 RepID=A0A8J5SS66_ZIZPA|nr:hypothetical protein GUJ93_ZPchr0006g44670 [Zizania palustris]
MEIERSLLNLHQVSVFLGMHAWRRSWRCRDTSSTTLKATSRTPTNSFVRQGAVELETALDYQKISRHLERFQNMSIL